MEELVEAAYKLTDPAKKTYGFVANGQKGPAVAQDWMQYNTEMGGSILGSDGVYAEFRSQYQEPDRLQGSLYEGGTSRRR